MFMDNLFAKVSEVIGNNPVSLLGAVIGYWQLSEKFVTGCQYVLATLCEFLQRLMAAFEKKTIFSEG
jgi:hypothetical protein